MATSKMYVDGKIRECFFTAFGNDAPGWYYKEGDKLVAFTPTTHRIASNGVLSDVFFENGKWYHFDPDKKEITDDEELQITLDQIICTLECKRSKIQDNPDLARKYSLAVNSLERALYDVRSFQFHEHFLLPINQEG